MGRIEVATAGGTIGEDRLGGRLPRQLLAHLVLERAWPIPKEELAEALWGDRLPATWAPTLRGAVHKLREALRAAGLPDAVAAVSGCYQLELPVDAAVDVERACCDVAAATQALAGGDARAAVTRATAACEILRRPFLPGCATVWAQQTRREFERVHVQAAEVAAEAHLLAGHPTTALPYAIKVVDLEPFSEAGHVRVMRAHAAAGNAAEALRVYDRYRRVLADELGVDPCSEARRLYEHLLGGGQGLPPVSARGVRPTEITAFVGRDGELLSVHAALTTAPLVTLVGPGGVGKSRLAREVAAASQDTPPVVELAPLDDPGLVPAAVAAAVGVSVNSDASPQEQLAAVIGRRRVLLVVDNCDHVRDAVAELVTALTTSCSGLRVLATSRTPLGVADEHTVAVPPLERDAALALFCDRARLADPSWRPGEDDLPVAAEICLAVDGLPLAIELAAARLRVLTLHQVRGRLTDRLGLLADVEGAAPDRHHTLRATLDWSHELLTAGERAALRRAAVFPGGFDLEAAEHVLAGEPIAPASVLDLVAALVQHSLIVADTRGPLARYTLLETVRAYALEQLAECGETAEAGRRHRDWFLRMADDFLGQTYRRTAHWRAAFAAETHNVRAGMRWSVEVGEHEAAVRMGAGLLMSWGSGGYGLDDESWLSAALEAISKDCIEYVVGCRTLALMHQFRGETDEAVRLAGLAAAAARTVQAPLWEGDATMTLAGLAMHQGKTDVAAAHHARVDALLPPDAPQRAWLEMANAAVALAHGDVAAWRSGLESTVTLARRYDNDDLLGLALSALAVLAVEAADLSQAATFAEEAATVARRNGNPPTPGLLYALTQVADVALAQGDLEGAATTCEEALRAASDTGQGHGLVWLLQSVALLCQHRDLPKPAARLLGWVDANPPQPGYQTDRKATLAVECARWAQQQLGEAGQIEHDLGAAWSAGEAVQAATAAVCHPCASPSGQGRTAQRMRPTERPSA